MDSITHVLSAALWVEPIPAPRGAGAAYARWREWAALGLAALLPDADGVLGWIDPALYAKYHRVATHSIVGLIVIAFLAALIARKWPQRWLLPFIRGRRERAEAVDPSWGRLLGVASLSVSWHWVGDWIAAWGIWPLWPFSHVDVSLRRVNSLDPDLLAITVAAWAVQHVLLVRGRRGPAWAVAGVWLAVCALYVWLRPHFGLPAYV